jgi:dTDP-4-dehydrorhamnose 3,5-epimerase
MEKGKIHDVVVTPLEVFADGRGRLIQMWRMDNDDHVESHESLSDKVSVQKDYNGPVMSYMSWTKPDVIRGLHLHYDQTDNFYFAGPGLFKVVMIDDRKDSVSSGIIMEVFAGIFCPKMVSVPPGVYHGYKNVSRDMGLVVNFPNSLYRGWRGKKSPDEEKHDPHELAKSFGYEWHDKDC